MSLYLPLSMQSLCLSTSLLPSVGHQVLLVRVLVGALLQVGQQVVPLEGSGRSLLGLVLLPHPGRQQGILTREDSHWSLHTNIYDYVRTEGGATGPNGGPLSECGVCVSVCVCVCVCVPVCVYQKDELCVFEVLKGQFLWEHTCVRV